MGRAYVGISGWPYAPWRGDFYPKGLPQRRELAYAASRLTSIEINGSFYSLQRPRRTPRGATQTPDDFVFAVKGGRFVTHLKRLGDVEDAARELLRLRRARARAQARPGPVAAARDLPLRRRRARRVLRAAAAHHGEAAALASGTTTRCRTTAR